MIDRMNAEVAIVNADPDFVGINIDHLFIADTSVYGKLTLIQDRLVSMGDAIKLARINEIEAGGNIQDAVETAQAKEDLKTQLLKEYLDKIPNLKHARINPGGTISPVSPSLAIVEEGDIFQVDINHHFVEQMGLVLDKCKDTVLVVPFYDHRLNQNSSDVPQPGEQTNRYTAICESLIDTFGEELQLEIGNETNVTRNTNGKLFGDLQFATRCDPEEYALFYCDVARQIKERYPSVELSLAGIACWDKQYLTTVLGYIKKYEDDNGLDKLVDTVSIHPYRDLPEEGSAEIANGAFTGQKMGYSEQLTEFKGVVFSYSSETRAMIGEINFNDSEAIRKLVKANQLTKSAGLVSLIYPGANVHH